MMSASACVLLILPLQLQAGELKPLVGPRIRVSPPEIGYHGLVDLSIDHDQPNDIVVCGFRYSISLNATIGYVYVSHDGGRSWHEALHDDSSKWVTEESCASGAGGKMFFMGESQLLDHGRAREVPVDEAGDIHLYSSLNGGRSWSTLTKHAWLDSTAMAIDSSHGLRRGRMYLFGAGDRQSSSGSISLPQLVTSNDGKILHGPVSPPVPIGFKYSGIYASTARILPNGDAVAVFMTRQHKNASSGDQSTQSETHVELFVTHDGGSTLEKLADLGAIQPCLAAMPSLDVDPRSGTLYVVWGTMEGAHCRLLIASSADGHNWTRAKHDDAATFGNDPAIAVNSQGIVGLFWADDTAYHCWRFSLSSDGAATFSQPTTVSRCVETSLSSGLSRSAYATPNVHRKAGPSQGWEVDSHAIGFSVVAAREGLLPWRVSLVADPAGDFHAAWPEPSDQAGALWSTTLSVAPNVNTAENLDAADVSDSLALDFLNSEYDSASGVYEVDVIATNVSQKDIKTPVLLSVESAYSRFFDSAVPLGSDEDQTIGPAAWALWPEGNAGVLHPGEPTVRRRLSFLLRHDISDPVVFGDLLAVKLKATTRP